MKEIIEYFDRSFVINLIDRVDRRRQVEREFKRIGLRIPNDKVEIFSAVRPTERGGFVDISTKGCFSSHRDVLELARHKRFATFSYSRMTSPSQGWRDPETLASSTVW